MAIWGTFSTFWFSPFALAPAQAGAPSLIKKVAFYEQPVAAVAQQGGLS